MRNLLLSIVALFVFSPMFAEGPDSLSIKVTKTPADYISGAKSFDHGNKKYIFGYIFESKDSALLVEAIRTADKYWLTLSSNAEKAQKLPAKVRAKQELYYIRFYLFNMNDDEKWPTIAISQRQILAVLQQGKTLLAKNK